MNRKIIFGVVMILGIGYFIFKNENGDAKSSSQDFASTETSKAEKSQAQKNEAPTITDEAKASAPRIPNQVETPRTGKYAFKNLRPISSIQEESAKRDQFLEKNKTGFTFDSSDQRFVLMKLRAAKEKSSPDSNRTLDHELIRIDSSLAQKVIVDDDTYPVVYRESNGKIALLTGVLLIQTSENSEAEKLALNYPMDLQTYDASIGLASYKVRSGEGLYDVYNRIKNTERIRSVTVEVLDSYKGY